MLRRYGANTYPGNGVHGLCIIVDRKGMLSEQDVVLCVPIIRASRPSSIPEQTSGAIGPYDLRGITCQCSGRVRLLNNSYPTWRSLSGLKYGRSPS
jgi:hypothetical protein